MRNKLLIVVFAGWSCLREDQTSRSICSASGLLLEPAGCVGVRSMRSGEQRDFTLPDVRCALTYWRSFPAVLVSLLQVARVDMLWLRHTGRQLDHRLNNCLLPIRTLDFFRAGWNDIWKLATQIFQPSSMNLTVLYYSLTADQFLGVVFSELNFEGSKFISWVTTHKCELICIKA